MSNVSFSEIKALDFIKHNYKHKMLKVEKCFLCGNDFKNSEKNFYVYFCYKIRYTGKSPDVFDKIVLEIKYDSVCEDCFLNESKITGI